MLRTSSIVFLLLCQTCLAAGPSEKDRAAAGTYMESKSLPALFEVCSASYPADERKYSSALSGWFSSNSRAISKGEKVLVEQAKRDGTNMEQFFAKRVQTMKDELANLPDAEKADRCSHVLKVVLSEQ